MSFAIFVCYRGLVLCYQVKPTAQTVRTYVRYGALEAYLKEKFMKKKCHLKLVIEPGCIGCGGCQYHAPEIFTIENHVSHLRPEVTEESLCVFQEKINRAALNCPVRVIKLIPTQDEQLQPCQKHDDREE